MTSALFVPQLASGEALKQFYRVGSWLRKEAKAASIAVSDRMTDVSAVRHEISQNRAPIDFLLLAHGRGCEELERLCCINLSEHSVSIHNQLQKGRD